MAKNAEEIRVLLKKHSVDLIILDIMMPGGDDGLTLCCQMPAN
ncbi:response regulator [Candidatus Coxiella mudrowiae]|nr:response regulator [Candidatus Coxiella mudrowiae]